MIDVDDVVVFDRCVFQVIPTTKYGILYGAELIFDIRLRGQNPKCPELFCVNLDDFHTFQTEIILLIF